MVLEAIISQTLIQKIGGGRCLATEIMVATDAIRALIRDDKTHQIPGMLEISQKDGMHTMNSDLARLYNSRMITLNDAISKSPNQEGLKRLLQEQGRA
jgi:twitching motility protein PilT